VVPRTVPGSHDVIPIRCALSDLVYSWLKHVPSCDCTCKVLGNPKDNYDVSVCEAVDELADIRRLFLYMQHTEFHQAS